MKDDTYEELKKKLADSEAMHNNTCRVLNEYVKAEAVMVAAGIVSQEKVKQAHEIVRSFTKD